MCRLRLILAIALCAVYRSHIRNDCSSFSLSNPANAGLLFSATLITDTLSREVLGTAEGVSSLGTMLDLFDTPEQDMFTLSIENDSSQSEFLINFDNSALVNGPDLFGSGASNLTGNPTNSPFSSPVVAFESPTGQLGFFRTVLADGTSVSTPFVFTAVAQVPAPPVISLLFLGIAGLLGIHRLQPPQPNGLFAEP